MDSGATEFSRFSTALDLSKEGIALRKAFLDFGDKDIDCLRGLHELLRGYAPEFAAEFYRHVLSFEATRSFVSDTDTLERLQRSQVTYFEGLTAGDYGKDYILHRLRVGMAHHRVGLGPSWYLGAYAKYLVGLLPESARRFGVDNVDFVETMQALIKIVLFDMGLAIETYIEARDQTIQGLRNYAEMVFETMHDGIFVLAHDLSILSVNRAGLQLFELSLPGVLGLQLGQVFDSAALVDAAAQVIREGGERQDLPFSLSVAGGGPVRQARVTLRNVCLADEDGQLLLVIEPLSEAELFRQHAEVQLQQSEAMLREAQAVAKIGSWRMDRPPEAGGRIECSDETCRLLGICAGRSVSSTTFFERVHPDDRDRVVRAWWVSMRGGESRLEYRVKINGETLWLEHRVKVAVNPEGEFLSATGTVQDITERRIAEMQIEQLAFYDPLTGLPNRALFQDRLMQALALAERQGTSLSLMFVDLDRFKEINDTQGHACGDLVLTELARRFRAALRHDETLARLGGDEFVIIAHQTGRSAATLIAERLHRTMLAPVEVGGCSFLLGASTGIAIYPNDGADGHVLLKHADIAMYKAKAEGGGYAFYSQEMGEDLARRMELARRFSRALSNNGLQLHYQPQCDLKSGKLTGAEALLRWHDEEWGWVSPAEFIPVAIERGLMVSLGEWVLKQACWQLQFWARAGLRLPERLAINVATEQIEQQDFASRALMITREAGVSPSAIELEITESSMMTDPESARRVTAMLVDAGFAFAIDDFGTGHSSLSYLKRFPASTLKIDMSFVRQMLTDRNDLSIVSTIIAMARSLGLKTLAEGVEELAQLDTLRSLGCDEAQGYYFSKALSPEMFAIHWLAPSGPPS